jgi:hypothetical protein
MEDTSLQRLIFRAPDVLRDMIEGNHPELMAVGGRIPFEVRATRTGDVTLA